VFVVANNTWGFGYGFAALAAQFSSENQKIRRGVSILQVAPKPEEKRYARKWCLGGFEVMG
jgi:hypothetical protein